MTDKGGYTQQKKKETFNHKKKKKIKRMLGLRNIQMVCEHYFGMTIDYMGYLPYDNSVWQSVRHRKPFILEDPNSTAVTHLEEIIRNLMNTPK